MKIIDEEMMRRAVERWENNPNRNKDSDFRWIEKIAGVNKIYRVVHSKTM